MLGNVAVDWMCRVSDRASDARRDSRHRAKLGKVAPVAASATPARGTLAAHATEDELLLRCLQRMIERDQAALGMLYDTTAARVHGVILRIVRRADLAEEVLADVYHQAWRECQRYDAARGKVIAWLLIIARSRALDALRRADEAFSHPDPTDLLTPDAVQSGDDDPLGLLEAARGNAALSEALAELSATQRQLIALAFFRGLSHAEIAAHTRLPLGSVKTHIRKALLQLRDLLAGSEGEF